MIKAVDCSCLFIDQLYYKHHILPWEKSWSWCFLCFFSSAFARSKVSWLTIASYLLFAAINLISQNIYNRFPVPRFGSFRCEYVPAFQIVIFDFSSEPAVNSRIKNLSNNCCLFRISNQGSVLSFVSVGKPAKIFIHTNLASKLDHCLLRRYHLQIGKNLNRSLLLYSADPQHL